MLFIESESLNELMEKQSELAASGKYKMGEAGDYKYEHWVTTFCLVESDSGYLDIEYRLKLDSKVYALGEMIAIGAMLKR